jgi:hypothetical protein
MFEVTGTRNFPTEWGRSSVGRAREWHSRGQGFDPPRLHCSVGLGSVGLVVCDAGPVVASGGHERYNPVRFAGIAQLVEHNLAKVGVAGSSPVSRSPRGLIPSG